MHLRKRPLAPAVLTPAPVRDFRTTARITLPPPAPLPSLRDAFARRAAVFGPVEIDEAPTAPRRSWLALGSLARRVAAALDLRQMP